MLWTSLEGEFLFFFVPHSCIKTVVNVISLDREFHSLFVICSLSYLHSKKIVHRDVKAENMLLDACKTLKIADFGVARVEAQNPQDMTGETGTLGYMAPEVLSSSKQVLADEKQQFLLHQRRGQV